MSGQALELARFTAQDEPQRIQEAIERDGAAIVEGLVSRECCDQVHREMAPYIERSAGGSDDFAGRTTTRTGALVARSPTSRNLVAHPRMLELCGGFLRGRHCEGFQLHLTQIIRILPGQGAQPLHRDRMAWGPYLKRSLEPQFNTIWAMNDFTAENGATQVVPGSQNWDWERAPMGAEICQAVMPAGSALIYTGSVLHGGGPNRSDDARLGANITYCANWLRQEENQYLSCPPELARTLGPELQDLLGYTMGGCGLGYFSPEESAGGSDTAPPEMALGRMPTRTMFDADAVGAEFVPMGGEA